MASRKPLGISAFFLQELGAAFANVRWSWGAVDARNRRVFLRVWRNEVHETQGRRVIQILNKNGAQSRPGWNERVQHIELMRAGYTAFGVLCDRESPGAGAILDFDRDALVVMGPITESSTVIVAEMLGTRTPADLQQASGGLRTLAADLLALAEQPELTTTTRAALADARIGQGTFRRQLLRAWGGACAVSGCSIAEALRASHAKPWRQSSNRERLDPSNGLILVATLDALFDAGLIAFEGDGSMVVSSALSAQDRAMLGLPANLRKSPNVMQASYFDYHREHVFNHR